MNQIDMPFPPATRSTDNGASHRAEERQNASGWRLHDSKLVLLGFYAHSGTTTKELSVLCGLDRHMVGRRAKDLLTKRWVDRIEGQDGWRWTLTAKGLSEVAKINGRNYPGRA